jgi:hypothetical protein
MARGAEPIRGIEDQIEAIMGLGHDLRTYQMALASLDTLATLRNILLRCKTESSDLLGVCRRSYAHPNGFTKIGIASGRDWALRLHVWQRTPPDVYNDLHDHCGFFVSRVLLGGIRNEEHVAELLSSSVRYLKYRDRLTNSVHRLVADGEIALSKGDVILYRRGDQYSLTRSVIHRTVPEPPFPVATLVLEGPREQEYSNVYRLRPRPEAEVVSTQCPPRLVLETLSMVLQG